MPFAVVRGVLGALCVLFAYPLGRSWLRVQRGQAPRSRAIHWTLRVTVTGLGVLFGVGLDWLSVTVFALAAASLAAGLYAERHPPKQEHLEKVMFPEE